MKNKSLSKEDLKFIEENFTEEDLEHMLQEKKEAIKQIRSANKEVSASLAGSEELITPPRIHLPIKLLMKIFLPILSLFVIVGMVWWFFSTSSEESKHGSVTEQIHALSTLTTAEAHVKTIFEQEDYKLFGKDISLKIPGTKRNVLMVVPATVIAGVDLSNVDSNDIKIDEETKELFITLPKAEIVQDPTIQMTAIQTFSNEGLFRSEATWEEGFEFAAEAKQQIKEEAISAGILQSAEKNAETALKGFFTNMDYKVKVEFK